VIPEAETLLAKAKTLDRKRKWEIADLIVKAMDIDPNLTYTEVSEYMEKPKSTIRGWVNWRRAGDIDAPIKQETETAKQAEVERKFREFLNSKPEVVAEELAKTNPEALAEAVAHSKPAADAIAANNPAANKVSFSRWGMGLDEARDYVFSGMRSSGDDLPFVSKLRKYSQSTISSARRMSLIWKDSAPVANERQLEAAQEIMDDTAVEVGKILANAVLKTTTGEAK